MKNERGGGEGRNLNSTVGKILSNIYQNSFENLYPDQFLAFPEYLFYKQTCSISKLLFPLSTIFERNFSSKRIEEGKVAAGSSRPARSSQRLLALFQKRGGEVLFIILPRLI